MPPARKTPARPTRPDDKPFDFNLDAVRAEVDTSSWVINWGGRSWTFLHFEELDVWDQISAAGLGNTEAMAKVFEFALGDQWPEFRKIRLPLYKTKALWKAYEEYCGINAGESQDSEPS
jgi:hypothetical protein